MLTAAVDGVMLHRALHPSMSSADVAPVLRRLLVARANADVEGCDSR